MELNELTAVPSADLPVAELSAHLHLGTGFADDGSQNSVLESYLRAALSAIESRIGKAIFERRFQWTVFAWNDSGRQGLPIAPVSAIESLKIVNATGAETVVNPSTYQLVRDTMRPSIIASGGGFPNIPGGGHADLTLLAGYSAVWSTIPTDLQQAVLLMAAHYFENRQGEANATDLPATVLALIAPYRPMRLSGRVA